ncbi:MAG: filamentous hemagglutinin N-terminal domain-containing protein [Pseudomonadota bacterium]|nr:filamentous hemagglutinin N-terminal domain-containing protein [Pseudomonadota bacterium]
MTARLTPAAFTQLSAAVAALFTVNPAQALDANALPSGGQVVAGQASISQVDARMDIRQSSERAILNWQGFDIGAQAQVHFQQPSAAAVALNRVVGVHSSEIQGRLTANGQVFLINPNGILFGANAQVDVGGLVASTLKLSDADFLAGNARFTDGNTAGGIVNQGNITAAEGGYVALIAPRIRNDGDISAPKGSVFAGAGDRVTLHFADNRLLEMEVSAAQVDTLIENHQALRAPSGHILLRAEAAADLASSAINNGGLIDASAITGEGGRIELLAGMKNGRIDLTGTLKAQGGAVPLSPAGWGEGVSTANGGQIETSAAQVKIADTACVDTRAPHDRAGTWLIDPTDYTVAASGGDISGATLAANLQLGNVILQTSAVGTGNGDLLVNDTVTWSADTLLTLTAHRDIGINAPINGTGASAGLALNPGAGGDYRFGSGGKITLPGTGATFSVGGQAYILIHDVDQLQAIRNDLAGHYALGNDIDASATAGWNGGAGFEPLAHTAYVGEGCWPCFQGTVTGLGHAINGLTIQRPAEEGVGLFKGIVPSGVVRDLGLTGVNITGGQFTGGLVGWSQGAISHVYVTGSVRGTHHVGGLAGYSKGFNDVYASASVSGIELVGGLVGASWYGTFSNTYATGSVSGSEYVGGLIGGAWNTTITNAYASGSVSGSSAVGGLVGHSDNSTLSNVYATGSVNGVDSVGGLVGQASYGSISNTYATGQVTGNTSTGGLVGAATDEYGDGYTVVAVTNSYWNTDTSNQSTSAAGTGLTTTQMQQQASYTDWDFANIWRIYEGQSTPVLRALQTDLAVTANNAGKPYDGQPWSGGSAAYSVPGATPAGALVYGGDAQGAVAPGTYTITPSGLLSDQCYHVSYAGGALTIQPPPAAPATNDAALRDALVGLMPGNPGDLPTPAPDGLIGQIGDGIRLPEGI